MSTVHVVRPREAGALVDMNALAKRQRFDLASAPSTQPVLFAGNGAPASLSGSRAKFFLALLLGLGSLFGGLYKISDRASAAPRVQVQKAENPFPQSRVSVNMSVPSQGWRSNPDWNQKGTICGKDYNTEVSRLEDTKDGQALWKTRGSLGNLGFSVVTQQKNLGTDHIRQRVWTSDCSFDGQTLSLKTIQDSELASDGSVFMPEWYSKGDWKGKAFIFKTVQNQDEKGLRQWTTSGHLNGQSFSYTTVENLAGNAGLKSWKTAGGFSKFGQATDGDSAELRQILPVLHLVQVNILAD